MAYARGGWYGLVPGRVRLDFDARNFDKPVDAERIPPTSDGRSRSTAPRVHIEFQRRAPHGITDLGWRRDPGWCDHDPARLIPAYPGTRYLARRPFLFTKNNSNSEGAYRTPARPQPLPACEIRAIVRASRQLLQ